MSLDKLMKLNHVDSLKKKPEKPKNIIEAENGDKYEVTIDKYGNVTTKIAMTERGMLV